MARLSRATIEGMGFASVGDNVHISDRASFYNCPHISIGSNIRIDDFCVLSAGSGGITIGDYVHIAVYSSLIGSGIITLSNFCNISSRVAIYSSSDDYSGEAMTNPMVPELYTNVLHADVFLGKHAIIGSGSVILPGVRIEEGAAVGALSLVRDHCLAFGEYAGTPAKFIKNRKKNLLDLESKFLKNNCSD